LNELSSVFIKPLLVVLKAAERLDPVGTLTFHPPFEANFAGKSRIETFRNEQDEAERRQ